MEQVVLEVKFYLKCVQFSGRRSATAPSRISTTNAKTNIGGCVGIVRVVARWV